jgi:hypothetical protein
MQVLNKESLRNLASYLVVNVVVVGVAAVVDIVVVFVVVVVS